ncbi:MAG: DUF4157 domain-containing protein [Acidobacteria bacterium]|nr:DUF4157 domain-containing protein [Acidobacteriota bacterium]
MKRERIECALPPDAISALQPFFPAFDLARIRIREGIPRYVIGDPLGYADGDVIYLQRGAYQPDTTQGLALLAHEIAHCQQYERLGKWRFRAEYLRAYGRNRRSGMAHDAAYWQVPFEIEARAIEDLVFETLQEQLTLAPQLVMINSGSLKLYEDA